MKDNNLVAIVATVDFNNANVCDVKESASCKNACASKKEIPKAFFFGVNRALELYTMPFIKFYDAASFFS